MVRDSLEHIDERSGAMKKRWALQHEYEGGYYYSYNELRKCQNPGHGGLIRHVYILRHRLSGNEVEVGMYCFQRWRLLNGMSTDPWFDDYLVGRQMWGRSRPGIRISYTEDREVEREARKRYLEREKIKLKSMNQPLENFMTIEAADDYAKEKGGYCNGTIEMVEVQKEVKCQNGHRIFSLYVPEETNIASVPKEHYLKILENRKCRRCGSPAKINILKTEKFWEIYVNPLIP